MKHTLTLAVIGCAMLCAAVRADAQVTVTVDPGASWLGFMNVSNLPEDGGAYQFGSPWGTADLVATFSGPVLTLSPNTIGDPAEYWYKGGGGPGAQGNKIMEANMYIEVTGPLSGTTVTFTGEVLSNSLTAAHTSVAFIKDFAPDYSSSVNVTVPLTSGVFSISLPTIADPARHVQYGFATTGPNVWITDVGPFGSVQVTAIPEPASIALVALGTGALVGFGRRRRFER
ncbi:MAG: PEP-CTERM sorting domain-containing protein [Pirellulales bacterium]